MPKRCCHENYRNIKLTGEPIKTCILSTGKPGYKQPAICLDCGMRFYYYKEIDENGKNQNGDT